MKRRTRDALYVVWAVIWLGFVVLAICGIVSWIVEAFS